MLNGYNVDKSLDVPIYKQLLTELTRCMESGELKPGQKLPAERELSDRLGISRGTVKNAYAELNRRKLVTMIQGSGTFVKEFVEEENKSDGGDVRQLIFEIYEDFLEKGYSPKEIYPMMESAILSTDDVGGAKLNIAAVDCNRETLSIFRSQLTNLGGINYMGFLLSDVLEFKNPDTVFAGYDLIFTTTTHFDELAGLLKESVDRLVRTAVSPDKRTIINLSKISGGDSVTVLTQSSRFARIIENNLKSIGIDVPKENFFLTEEIEPQAFKTFFLEKEYLIIPPFHAMDLDYEILTDILEYNGNRGKIAIFNYTIEKGSLIYFEETLKRNILPSK